MEGRGGGVMLCGGLTERGGFGALGKNTTIYIHQQQRLENYMNHLIMIGIFLGMLVQKFHFTENLLDCNYNKLFRSFASQTRYN